MSLHAEDKSAKRWLVGLRHAWSGSGAIDRYVEDRGVTGVVYVPNAYEVDDLAAPMADLVNAGARADASLLWDFAVEDIRIAAEVLRDAYDEAGTLDGYVVVWIDPNRANDPDKAVKAAVDIIGDVKRANVALALAWMPQRAAVVERLVRSDVPLALSAVRDQAAVDQIAQARARGMEQRRKDVPEAAEVPVFLLGSQLGADHVFGTDLFSEFDLMAGREPTGRVPLAPDAETAAFTGAAERLAARAKRPAHDDTWTPADFAAAVASETAELDEDEVIDDTWARDHTLWQEDPADVADRLGWLDVADRMWEERKSLAEFGRRTRSTCDAKHIVLAGMGGSSLGADAIVSCVGGTVPLHVLDTTHPDHIAAVIERIDLEHAIFVIASKSGTTVETRAHLEYLWSLVPNGERFVAVTDPGSELAKVAAERGFARTFENPPDIGGRFAALSYFGLVPAVLCGADIDPVLSGAHHAIVANAPGAQAQAASGTRLGAALATAANAGRDKLTLMLPDSLRTFGDWIEQLIAESTGKSGKGVVPVLEGADPTGEDRVAVRYTMGDSELPDLDEQPLIEIRIRDARDVGAEMYRWEFATAMLGYLLDINPFDQPDVEAAKQRARDALSSSGGSRPEAGEAKVLLDGVAPPSYVAVQAFVAPSEANAATLRSAAAAIRKRTGCAVTVGFGPRFLHSTGQLHKGGPGVVCLQVTDERTRDIDVPGVGFSFGTLLDAQADGDLLALREAGRSVARVTLDELAGMTQQ